MGQTNLISLMYRLRRDNDLRL